MNKFILITLSLMTFCVYAEDDFNCKSNNDIASHLVQMWEFRTLEKQNILIECISDSWELFLDSSKIKDSEFRYKASSYLMSALQFNPDNFFLQMNKRDRLLEVWLKYIPDGAFTWYNDGACGFETQLLEIKNLMKHVSETTKELKAYNKSSMVINSIECFIVD